MASTLGIAEVAALVGEPARAAMLMALMSGRAMTAKELSITAGVSAPTTSAHLARMTAARLLVGVSQGRHRYYRLTSPAVGRMIESITLVAAIEAPPRHVPYGPKDAALRAARTCYDHLAGRLAVGMADRLAAGGHVILDDEGGEVTARGTVFLAKRLAIDVTSSARGRRPFCRPCLDWSERRYHLGGRLGALILSRCVERAWLTRQADSRVVDLTPLGRAAIADLFGLSADTLDPEVNASAR
ncbi:MAG: helix-turn-helix transcriptional regulator [Geminicoccaceae bacterium]|nr:helix-turn-helix transcriptional regulator [Geminicoccaceae bacterium]